MTNLFHLPGPISDETVTYALELLEKALKGEIIGLSCAAICPGGAYEYCVTGQASTEPERALGAVCRLIHLLNQHIELLESIPK